MHVAHGPRQNSHRPSIDVLFRSAAESYGERVVAVLLSGMGGDGAAGSLLVKEHGGVSVIQDPEEAAYPSMLRQTATLARPDYVLPAGKIGALLVDLVQDASRRPAVMPVEHRHHIDPEGPLDIKHPSPYSCPECGGVLWEDEEAQLYGLRCRVGHVYSYDSLLEGQTQQIESALWAGLRALEEKAALLRKMADMSRERQQQFSPTRFELAARELETPAETLRRLVRDRRLYALPQRDDSPPTQPTDDASRAG